MGVRVTVSLPQTSGYETQTGCQKRKNLGSAKTVLKNVLDARNVDKKFQEKGSVCGALWAAALRDVHVGGTARHVGARRLGPLGPRRGYVPLTLSYMDQGIPGYGITQCQPYTHQGGS